MVPRSRSRHQRLRCVPSVRLSGRILAQLGTACFRASFSFVELVGLACGYVALLCVVQAVVFRCVLFFVSVVRLAFAVVMFKI